MKSWTCIVSLLVWLKQPHWGKLWKEYIFILLVENLEHYYQLLKTCSSKGSRTNAFLQIWLETGFSSIQLWMSFCQNFSHRWVIHMQRNMKCLNSYKSKLILNHLPHKVLINSGFFIQLYISTKSVEHNSHWDSHFSAKLGWSSVMSQELQRRE